MQIPSLKQLERALHIRGTIEALQSELAALFTTLGEAIAPTPSAPSGSKPKPPFADSIEGAKSKRLAKTGTAKRKHRNRKSKVAAEEKTRIRNVLTGGEEQKAPVAAEPKMRRRKVTRKARRAKKKKH